MKKGNISIYAGEGRGKSQAAIGRAVQNAEAGGRAVLIQFLKGKGADYSILSQYDEINFFTFENSEKTYEDMTPDERGEHRAKVQNNFQYARKVIETGSADIVILDEVLGLRDYNILDMESLISLVDINSNVKLILTGRNCPEELKSRASMLSHIEPA